MASGTETKPYENNTVEVPITTNSDVIESGWVKVRKRNGIVQVTARFIAKTSGTNLVLASGLPYVDTAVAYAGGWGWNTPATSGYQRSMYVQGSNLYVNIGSDLAIHSNDIALDATYIIS